MRTNLLKTDLKALTGIAFGALVGGVATAALAADGDDRHRHADVEMSAECAVEGTTPRVVVTGRSESRVIVAPNVRIGVGSSCADGRQIHVAIRDHDSDHKVHVYRLDGEMDEDARERMDRARERMERAQERIERARERAEQARERSQDARERAAEARERAAEARGRLERVDWAEVDDRLREADAQLRDAATVEALRTAEQVLQNRLRMLEEDGVGNLEEVRERLVDIEARLADDLDAEVREDLTREMRRLRVALDRALAASRGAGNR